MYCYYMTIKDKPKGSRKIALTIGEKGKFWTEQ